MRNRGVISHPVISEAARLFLCAFCMCISVYLSLSLSLSLQGMFTACYSMPTVSPFRKQSAWLFPYVLSDRSYILTAVDEDLSSELQGPLGGHISLSHWTGGSVGPGTYPFVQKRLKIPPPQTVTRKTMYWTQNIFRLFWARSHISEKHLLPSSLSVHPSVNQFRPHASAWVPVDGFSSSFKLGTFIKIYPENAPLVTIRQKYRQLYTKT